MAKTYVVKSAISLLLLACGWMPLLLLVQPFPRLEI
jgi:hypothetical protein